MKGLQPNFHLKTAKGLEPDLAQTLHPPGLDRCRKQTRRQERDQSSKTLPGRGWGEGSYSSRRAPGCFQHPRTTKLIIRVRKTSEPSDTDGVWGLGFRVWGFQNSWVWGSLLPKPKAPKVADSSKPAGPGFCHMMRSGCPIQNHSSACFPKP